MEAIPEPSGDRQEVYRWRLLELMGSVGQATFEFRVIEKCGEGLPPTVARLPTPAGHEAVGSGSGGPTALAGDTPATRTSAPLAPVYLSMSGCRPSRNRCSCDIIGGIAYRAGRQSRLPSPGVRGSI